MQSVVRYTDCDLGDVREQRARSAILAVDTPRRLERNASPTVSAPLDELRNRLPALTLADEHRLGRRIDGLRRTRDPQARARQLERIAADVAVAEERIARRRAAVPVVRYPEE